MDEGRTEQGVTALVGVAVGVGDVAAQQVIAGTVDAAGVAQRELRLAHGQGEGEGGKDVVVGAALLVHAHFILIIVRHQMLVAHARLGLQLAEGAGILQEGGGVVLADVAVVVVQDALVVDVGVHVVGVGVFAAEGEVAFPQGAADDELGGVEGVLVLVVAGDALLLRGFAGGDVPLVHVLQGLAVRPEAVGVEVDVPVARLPVVIDVEGVAGGGVLLPSARGVLLVERVVLEHIRLHGVEVQFVLRRPVVVVTDADGVVFVELVVERQHGGEVHAGIIRAEVALLPPRLVEKGLGEERLVLLAIDS